MKTVSLYCLGHGSRDAGELLALLNTAGIVTLVDVRTHPTSARYPHFSQEALRRSLESHGMVYYWAGRQMGGLRLPRPDSAHTALESEGLRGFADHMQTEAFQRGVLQLLNLGMKAPKGGRNSVTAR